jgi:hypothetical protein
MTGMISSAKNYCTAGDVWLSALSTVPVTCGATSYKLHSATSAELLAPTKQWSFFNQVKSVAALFQQFLQFWMLKASRSLCWSSSNISWNS